MKEKLFMYLDWFVFVNYDEVYYATCDFINDEGNQFVYGYDIDEIDEEAYAMDYIIARWLEFESDIVNWEDLNHVEDWKQRILDYNNSKDE